MKQHSNKGFTLVELLVVIGIIGILSVVAVPALLRNIQKAQVSELESDYSAIRSAVLAKYAEETVFDRGFGDLDKIIGYMENIDNKSPLGGKYNIEVDMIDETNNNPLNFGGYRIDSDGNLSNRVEIVKDYKMVLAIRPESWDSGNKPIGSAKITKEQFKKLAKDIGYDRVYICLNNFTTAEGQEIYIGLIPK